MGIFNDAGLLIIGSRLKRLGDRFLNEVSKVYKVQNIRFEPAWFPVFYLLDKRGSLSLTEIAAELDVSHSAISQMITQLLNKKMVEIQQDSSDARIKKIVFSEKGKKLIEQVHPVWEALRKSLGMVLPQDHEPAVFLHLMSHMEEKLSNSFLSDTTLNIIQEQTPEVELITPETNLKKKLMLWIKNENSGYRGKNDLFLVALHRGNIIGYISYEIRDEAILLNHVYVDTFLRRKGIAFKMIQYLNNLKSPSYFLVEEPNLDLIKVLVKAGYSFKVK